MVAITSVLPNSIADSLKVDPGDRVVAVNGEPVRDFLDVILAERLADVTLVVEKADGDVWELEIEKEEGQPFGLALEHPEPARCGNKCLFCFVHQLPKGMRRTLYIKDEDYRFSYLYGAYITLSNVFEDDLDRIVRQKLSPLYISVHATDEKMRSTLLGRELPAVLPMLGKLVNNGIELHTQIVVCPGFNDGSILEESVRQVYELGPQVKSLALVPVGLTEHRLHLPKLDPVTPEQAGELLDALADWQGSFRDLSGSRFVFAADEFYLRAGRELPGIDEYEDLAQIENGVGMIALFRDMSADVLQEAASLNCPVEFSVVTGKAFRDELAAFLERLSVELNCRFHLHAVDNRLFGSPVTVAGLVAGKDIADQLAGKNLGSALFVPDVMMRDGADHFLDDETPESLSGKLDCKVVVVESTPWGLLDAIEGLSED